MALTADQIIASHKANVETLFGLTTKAFEGVEKLVELNVTASKAALTEAAGTTQALLSVKDAQELLALQAGLFQPLAEKTAAYSRHLYEIAPAGSETAVAVMKSAVAAANNAFESVQKAVKQATDVAEANFQAVSTTAVNAAKSTAQTAARKRA
jgi:phasin family protein